MKITKEDIEKELKSDGSLKTKTHLTKYYTIEQLYQIYKPDFSNACEVCGNASKFKNFNTGYERVCSRKCRKELMCREYVPDTNNIVTKNELINFINEFSEGQTTNKLNIYYFINNGFERELNTLYHYGVDIHNMKIRDLYDFVYGKQTCRKCGKETSFITFAQGYREYCSNKCSKTVHMNEPNIDEVMTKFVVNNHFSNKEMMKEYNVSESYVNKYKQNHNIDIPNKLEKYTFGEKFLYNTFKDRGLEFKTNSRNIINPYEIDFVIGNLCIEYDGLMFHSNGHGFPGDNSKRFKDKLIPDEYQLVTIFENEFLDEKKRKIWISVIENKLKLNKTSIYARKCVVQNVDTKTAAEFENANHLQGSCKSSIRLGLYYEDELVSLMTFGKSRFNKNVEYELIRFCSKVGANVVGGAGKLLRHFERTYEPESIISYANKRWSDGSVYEKLEFEFIEDTRHNYFYFMPNENILYSRNRFQKHKLQKLLGIFDSNLTEEQNMFNNGYRKIYDYGNKKYIKRYKKGA